VEVEGVEGDSNLIEMKEIEEKERGEGGKVDWTLMKKILTI